MKRATCLVCDTPLKAWQIAVCADNACRRQVLTGPTPALAIDECCCCGCPTHDGACETPGCPGDPGEERGRFCLHHCAPVDCAGAQTLVDEERADMAAGVVRAAAS